jgi:hypothetical protein
MLTFGSILFSTLLVAILITVLHRYQINKFRETADRSNPLAPLIPITPYDDDLDSLNSERSVTVVSEIAIQPCENLSWQEEVKNLRESGYFQEALTLCRRQYPKMLAFRQSLVTLRACIKKEEDIPEERLASLYQTAILGNMIKHKKNTACFDISHQRQKIQNPRECWQNLGYRNLDLLTKTDCRLLVKYWGEPDTHTDIVSLLD